jgi:hypothetical protein
MAAQDAAGYDITGDEAVEDLMLARDDLMDSILQDEEEIIAMHRQQIEESMEIVRKYVMLSMGQNPLQWVAHSRRCIGCKSGGGGDTFTATPPSIKIAHVHHSILWQYVFSPSTAHQALQHGSN